MRPASGGEVIDLTVDSDDDHPGAIGNRGTAYGLRAVAPPLGVRAFGDPPQRVTGFPAEDGSVAEGTWACSLCTLINDVRDAQCQVCAAARLYS